MEPFDSLDEGVRQDDTSAATMQPDDHRTHPHS